MSERRTLTQRLYLIVGGVAAALVASIVALVVAALSFQERIDERERLLPATADVTELTALLTEQRAAAADPGATSSGAADRLAVGRQRLDVIVGRLESALAHDPALLTEAQALRTNLQAWELEVADDPVVRPIDSPALDRLVTQAEELSVAVARRTADATHRASASRAWFLRGVGASVVLGAGLLVVGTLALRRVVIHPVLRLSAQVSRVADGAYGEPIGGDGSRELDELAESVRRMRDHVLTERDQAQRAIESVDQEAPAMAALRTLLQAREAPCPGQLDCAGALVPADGILAGDWYDITSRPNSVIVTVGDVCGHGVDAGLLAVRTKFALLDAIDLGLHPAAALELASSRFGRTDTFATVLVAEFDLLAGTCRYASAGHNPMLLLRADGRIERLERTGPLIGMAQGPRPNTSVALEPGDTMVLYTDGVVEARPRRGEQFLEQRLVDLLTSSPGRSSSALAELVLNAVVSHCEGRCPDDATIAVVQVKDLAVDAARVA